MEWLPQNNRYKSLAIRQAQPVEKIVEPKLRYIIVQGNDHPVGMYFLANLTVSQHRHGS